MGSEQCAFLDPTQAKPQVQRVQTPSGGTSAYSAAASPDGSAVWLSSGDGTVHRWTKRFRESKVVRSRVGEGYLLSTMAAVDSNSFAAGSENRLVQVGKGGTTVLFEFPENWKVDGVAANPTVICVAANEGFPATRSRVTAIDAKSGFARWSRLGDPVQSVEIIGKDLLAVGGPKGLQLLTLDNGDVRWLRTDLKNVQRIRWAAGSLFVGHGAGIHQLDLELDGYLVAKVGDVRDFLPLNDSFLVVTEDARGQVRKIKKP